MSESAMLQFGDQVRHVRRPEWGIGMVSKIEQVTSNGHPTQRVTVRFPHAGVKVLSTAHAELARVTNEPAASSAPVESDETPSLAMWDRLAASGWLEPVAQRKIQQVMSELPPAVKDPFLSLQRRLGLTLELYRFEKTGGSLLDWAVAQTGLPDPLARFNRHELETHFQRWANERDAHLSRLLQEARSEQGLVAAVVRAAPPGAHDAVRRLMAFQR